LNVIDFEELYASGGSPDTLFKAWRRDAPERRAVINDHFEFENDFDSKMKEIRSDVDGIVCISKKGDLSFLNRCHRTTMSTRLRYSLEKECSMKISLLPANHRELKIPSLHLTECEDFSVKAFFVLKEDSDPETLESVNLCKRLLMDCVIDKAINILNVETETRKHFDAAKPILKHNFVNVYADDWSSFCSNVLAVYNREMNLFDMISRYKISVIS
jgi:hypothetical protein